MIDCASVAFAWHTLPLYSLARQLAKVATGLLTILLDADETPQW